MYIYPAKTRNKTAICSILVFITISTVLIGCQGKSIPKNWGTHLKFEGSDLFYTNRVSEDEARKLGEYLVTTGFFQKDNPGTVQLTKEGSIYQLRMVTKKGSEEDLSLLQSTGMFAAYISQDVFNKAPVEVHLCDGRLKTLKVITFEIKNDNSQTGPQ